MTQHREGYKVVGIIQARTGSSRLPRKSLAEIAGKPLLGHVLERMTASHLIGQLIVATTTDTADEEILRLADSWGVPSYAGSSHDVLDRIYRAAQAAEAQAVVRITADDPFKDPVITDQIVEHLLLHPELHYVSNTIEPTYPEGLDIEVLTFDALQQAWTEARTPSDREHVTPYIYNNPDRFKTANIRHHTDLSHLRWTIDYEADLRFAREVYFRLYHKGIFLMEDILELLRKEPELVAINRPTTPNIGHGRAR